MFLNRSGGKNRENPGYVKFASSMKYIFDEYERATPADYVGFFKGDLLYFNTPPIKGKNYVFKPNVVEYAVDVTSDLGKRIGARLFTDKYSQTEQKPHYRILISFWVTMFLLYLR